MKSKRRAPGTLVSDFADKGVDTSKKHPTFIVGIASSAGGLMPLIELLKNASCHENMAFVLVPHLSRTYKTQLPKLLGKVSHMKTDLIRHGMEIEKCRLFILPPGYYVHVKDGLLCLQPRPENTPNQAADVLFKSLAQYYGENSIGVVLSGSAVGADGSEGVKAIHKAGGHTYAQSPETAEFPQMPQLAIETGAIDSVMDAAAIGHELTLVNWAHRESSHAKNAVP